MTSCFVNYRTGDGEQVATLLGRELALRFGSEEVFRASDSITAGSDFEQEIRRAVRRCEVLLAVIGTRWLEPRESDGLRAIDDPDDWTRWEIAAAFAAGATVIPVLMESTPRLRKQDLPEELAPLARCQYRRLRHRTVESDLGEIAEAVLIAVPRLEEKVENRADSKLTAEQGPEPSTGNTMRDVEGPAVQAREFTNNGVVGEGDVGMVVNGSPGNVVGESHGPIVSGDNNTTHTGKGDIDQSSTVNHVAGDQHTGDQHIGRIDRRGRR